MATGDSLPDAGLAGRYLALSALNVVNHQVVLFVGNSVLGLSAGVANVIAATVAAVPAFIISYRWVWRSEGDPRSQIVPFWLIALAGLAVSTGMAIGAERAFGAGLAVNAAAFVGYFFVWVAKFFLLDRLFRAEEAT